jgi:methylated-DNA-[protein]-cysteine S-methyltransferase
MRLFCEKLASPLGELILLTDEAGAVRALDFADCETRMQRLLALHYGRPLVQPAHTASQARGALEAYFAGDIRALDMIETANAGRMFQRAVWQKLREIPAGSTISYAALAQRVGRPKASRAVGAANGSNPVAIIVPCHRVISASGALCGYGGGVDRKAWLIAHERRCLLPLGEKVDQTEAAL